MEEKIKRDERVHDLLGCYSSTSGKVFYTNPDGIGDPFEKKDS